MELRCFISLELPEGLKESIYGLTAPLRESGADVKWVFKESFHITLKFLGRTPEELLPEIRKGLGEVSGLCGAFDVAFSGAGVFPDERRPRVVWVGIGSPKEVLGLREEIERRMALVGFPPEERGFKPHLTIGRVRSLKGSGDLTKELVALKETLFGKIRVERISLMRSELKRTGAEYSVLGEFPLRAH